MTTNINNTHEKALASLAEFLKDDTSIEQQRAELQLEKLAEKYTMLLDTSAVLHEQFPAFAHNLAPILKTNGKAVLLPASVIRELKTLCVSKLELRDQARDACDALQMLQEEGVLRLCGDEKDGFADKVILMMANQCRTEADMLVITQDCQLSRDLLHLNELESVSGKTVVVFRVTRYGYLTRYLSEEERHMVPADEPDVSTWKPDCSLWQPEAAMDENSVVQVDICVDCGRHFVITQGQAERFRARGLMLPKRCYPCRHARKQNVPFTANLQSGPF